MTGNLWFRFMPNEPLIKVKLLPLSSIGVFDIGLTQFAIYHLAIR